MGRHAAAEEVFTANLAEFFGNSNVGLAIFDGQLRYRALNPWLANVHGHPIDFHLGKTLLSILGEEVAAAPKAAIRRVLATGRPISNLEINGKLPNKTVAERWVDNFFPIKNHRGEVHLVGAVVVAVPAPRINDETGLHQDPGQSGILRSWKEIASYVGACAKTVQRWEQEHKFPIRRVRASKGAVVFAMREEVDSWLSHGARTMSGVKHSWAMFTNSPLPTLILNDDRIILDANVSMANLIGAVTENLIGKNLDSFTCGTNAACKEQEWLLLRQTGASIGLRNFYRENGTVFAAEYTLRTMQPGVRILTFTSLREEPVSEKNMFHRSSPRSLSL